MQLTSAFDVPLLEQAEVFRWTEGRDRSLQKQSKADFTSITENLQEANVPVAVGNRTQYSDGRSLGQIFQKQSTAMLIVKMKAETESFRKYRHTLLIAVQTENNSLDKVVYYSKPEVVRVT